MLCYDYAHYELFGDMKMKKSIFLVLMSMASWVNADSLCNYLFDIVVKNNTGVQCHLIYQNVRMGNSMSRGKTVHTIENGEQSLPFTFETTIGFVNEAVDVDLSFICGEDKMATFSSKKSLTKYIVYNAPTFEGNTSSLSNMDADFVVKPQSCYISKPRPDTMIWTLH